MIHASSAQEHIQALKAAGIKPPASAIAAYEVSILGVIDFGEKYFYIPETGKPIKFEQFQKIILKIITGVHNYPTLQPFYSTILYSSIKKVGKTAITGVIGRWRAEQIVYNDEILFFANDEEQSRGRAYAAIQKSIELDPTYDRARRILPDKTGAPKWRVIDDYLEHIPTNTRVKAVNVDYRGESGANPSLTCWTEAWGFDTPKQLKLYEEETPVLTREHSQRIVESYAGYTGKSIVLENLWQLATDNGSRRLTLDDIPDWPWPDEYELPLYINDQSGVFAYIDQGPIARLRVPWTQGPIADKYYAEQSTTLTAEQYDRLHLNYWVSPTSAFLPLEWWVSCRDPMLGALPAYQEPITIKECPSYDNQTELQAYIHPSNWKRTGAPAIPVVGSIDASVSGDCTAYTGVTRHPQRYQDAALRFSYAWTPSRSNKLDYGLTPHPTTGLSLAQTIITTCLIYNMVEIAYDEWQLHHLMNEIRVYMQLAWCRPFSQSTARDVADKQLYDMVKARRIHYNDLVDPLDNHIKNAAKKQRSNEDTKLHIVKIREEGKIDLVVSLSMGVAECMRLDL